MVYTSTYLEPFQQLKGGKVLRTIDLNANVKELNLLGWARQSSHWCPAGEIGSIGVDQALEFPSTVSLASLVSRSTVLISNWLAIRPEK